jgi:hypothetical protein
VLKAPRATRVWPALPAPRVLQDFLAPQGSQAVKA